MGKRYDAVRAALPIGEWARANLKPSGNGQYCCPVCGSGTHGRADSDGALTVYPATNTWYCFAHTGGGDVVDLIAAQRGVGASEALEIAEREAGIESPSPNGYGWNDTITATSAGKPAAKPKQSDEKPDEPADYSTGRNKWAARLKGYKAAYKGSPAEKYATGRGFSAAEAEAFGFGWDGYMKRLTMPDPVNEWFFVGRSVEWDALHDTPGYKGARLFNPPKEEVGPRPAFNLAAFESGAPVVFVVEGPMDALTLTACGFHASALCGSGNANAIAQMGKTGYSGVVAVALDNDATGDAKRDKVVSDLRAQGLKAYPAKFPAGVKDANELFRRGADGRAALTRHMAEEAERVAYEAGEGETDLRKGLADYGVKNPADVAAAVFSLSDYVEPVPTGIPSLDRALDGGLRRGVIVLGAISSLGKTTLALQIADGIAACGRPVLFVTIEQSAAELVSKSLCRLMAAEGHTVTSTSMNSRERRAQWGEDKAAALEKSVKWYTKFVAPNLHIMEKDVPPTVAEIAQAARKIEGYAGRAPVVFVDYLQLVRSDNERDDEKRATDKAMTAFKKLSNDLSAPVFVISSLNRASYSGYISMESFKESGAIEYGADVLMGLQPYGIMETLDGVADGKKKDAAKKIMRETKGGVERLCEIRILKNRNGATPDEGIPLTFLPIPATFYDGAGVARVARGNVVPVC